MYAVWPASCVNGSLHSSLARSGVRCRSCQAARTPRSSGKPATRHTSSSETPAGLRRRIKSSADSASRREKR
eukprot:5995245-Pyramimonas_sp.AAC.2